MVLGKVNSHEARNELTANANLPEHLLALKINSLIYLFFLQALPDTETVCDLTPCFSLLASL